MGQVIVDIGGRNYPLSCRDGDEAHLGALGASIAAKADGLTESLGPMSEAKLLLMAALMVADELHEVRSGKTPAATATIPAITPATTDDRLAVLIERAERLAAHH